VADFSILIIRESIYVYLLLSRESVVKMCDDDLKMSVLIYRICAKYIIKFLKPLSAQILY